MVLQQFEPEGELLAEDVAGNVAGTVAGEGDGDKTEVRSGIGAEFGTVAVVEAVVGAWPETVAVSGPAVAGGEDDAGAGGKLLRFY